MKSFPFCFGLMSLILFGCSETIHEKMKHEEFSKRPNFHFTPKSNWINDPNGMFFLNGTYHLYFQYHPFSNVWGPMHWGHATSKDLLHWEEHAIALYPDSLGTIFSGSCVVDYNNTSGFGKDGQTPIIALYTNHDSKGEEEGTTTFQTQSIAYSLDEGFSWIKYDGNPVIPNPGIKDFRDPKVFWDTTLERWVMALAVKDRIYFYASDTLKEWEFLSEFGAHKIGSYEGVWECPELFELPVAGHSEKKWVLLVSINPGGPNGGSATQYFVGDWDGKTFTPDQAFVAEIEKEHTFWLDFGTDNYASVSFDNLPNVSGKKVIMGWQSNWNYARKVPTEKWKNGMTLPREIDLIPFKNTYRLRSTPTPFWEKAIAENNIVNSMTIKGEKLIVEAKEVSLEKIDIKGTALLEKEDSSFAFLLKNSAGDLLDFGYDGKTKEFYLDRSKQALPEFDSSFANAVQKAKRTSSSKTIPFQIILDKTSAELFFDKGETVMTSIFFPKSPFESVSIKSEHELRIEDLRVSEFPLEGKTIQLTPSIRDEKQKGSMFR